MIRRVDRLELIDLTTVHRTITLTLDTTALPSSDHIALCLFRRHAGRAGIRVSDATGSVVAFESNLSSDRVVAKALAARLEAAGIDLPSAEVERLLKEVEGHSADCCSAIEAGRMTPSAELAIEKWGCAAAGRIVRAIRRANVARTIDDNEAATLVRLVFDWQNNTVLLLKRPRDGVGQQAWATLTVSYDEELSEWLPPLDRRVSVLGRRSGLRRWWRLKRRISRGGPFAPDLDALMPKWPWRYALALSPWRRARRWGRRGLLGNTWHVAWEQSTGGDVERHHVEIVLPPELIVVRMRLLAEECPSVRDSARTSRYGDRASRVVAADEVGIRAHLIAPPSPADRQSSTALTPSLISVVVAVRNEGLWLAGALVALATGSLVFAGGVWERADLVGNTESAVTTLLLAPTLIATWLSFRATSAIAATLTGALQRLLTAVAALAVACGVVLVAEPHGNGVKNTFLGPFWGAAGVALAIVGVLLAWGWSGTRKLRREGEQREARRELRNSRGKRLRQTRNGPPTPPPDRWVETGEGDREPWGWLLPVDEPLDRSVDELYWRATLEVGCQESWEAEAVATRLWRVRLP